MPYDSITGQWKVFSTSCIVVDGKGAELDLINLNFVCAIISEFLFARERIAWCIVGTALYHVGENTLSHEKNFKALNPVEAKTFPPENKEESNKPTIP